MAEPAPSVQMHGMTKRFGATLANDAIDFDLRPGEIHGLLGENGSGKTTLISLLYGIHQPEGGEIRLAGAPVRIRSPGEALARGIAMIPQRFRLVPTLTVAENIALGVAHPRLRHSALLKEVARRVADLSEAYELQTNPTAVVGALSMGERQRVEILRALYHDARILLMDEPTSVLTPQEVTALSRILSRMARNERRSVVLVTHKIRELTDIADRITVLRGGRRVATFVAPNFSTGALLEAMIGQRDTGTVQAGPTSFRQAEGDLTAPTVCALTDVRLKSRPGDDLASHGLRGISLRVRAGEIVGVAGVEGNGQRELELILAGILQPEGGTVEIRTGVSPAMGDGAVAYVPSDRDRWGVLADLTVAENLLLRHGATLPALASDPTRQAGHLQEAAGAVTRFGIHPPYLLAPVRHLSGGNMQKVVIARELSRGPALVVAAQPTMGLDVTTAAFVRRHLRGIAATGAAVLVISSDLDELLDVCHRIVVMYRGRLIGEWATAHASVAEIGAAMAGLASGGPNTAPSAVAD